jgi:hypothetical protein
MPNRILRDGINDSAAVNSLSLRGEVFYRRLMSFADDYGRAPLNAALLRGKMFALQVDQWSNQDILDSVHECTAHGLIRCYEVDGYGFIEINKFGQRVRPGCKSKFPNPPSDAVNFELAEKGGVTPPKSALARAASPSPTTTTHTPPSAKKSADGFSDWFERIYGKHPKKKNKTLAEQAASERYSAGYFSMDDFERRHSAWCRTEQWLWKAGANAPTLAEWITDEGYLYDPPSNSNTQAEDLRPGHMNPGLLVD